MSLEKEFLESLQKNTMCVQVGCRHSGKTTWACSLLRYLMLQDNFFGEFHLILPTYESGQTGGTFDWIDDLPLKVRQRITIYCEFSMVIVNQLIDQSDGVTNRFLYVDDATSETVLFSNDVALKAVSSKARHYKITTFLCFHFLKKTLSTQLRNSAEWIILHRATDAKLLEGIWEECASLFFDKNVFMGMCREEMSKDYPSVILWRDKGQIDVGHGMDWHIQITHRDKVLKEGRNKKKHNSNGKADNVQTSKCEADSESGGLERSLQQDKGDQMSFSGSVARLAKRKKPNRVIARI